MHIALAVQKFLQVMQRKKLFGDKKERQIIMRDLFSIRCFIPTHKDEVGAQNIVTVVNIFPEVCHLQSWRR